MCDIIHCRETNSVSNPCHCRSFFRIRSSHVNLNWAFRTDCLALPQPRTHIAFYKCWGKLIFKTAMYWLTCKEEDAWFISSTTSNGLFLFPDFLCCCNQRFQQGPFEWLWPFALIEHASCLVGNEYAVSMSACYHSTCYWSTKQVSFTWLNWFFKQFFLKRCCECSTIFPIYGPPCFLWRALLYHRAINEYLMEAYRPNWRTTWGRPEVCDLALANL